MDDNPTEVDNAFDEDMEATEKKEDAEEGDTGIDLNDGGTEEGTGEGEAEIDFTENEEYIVVDEDDDENEEREYDKTVSEDEEFVLVDREGDELSGDEADFGEAEERTRQSEEFEKTGLYVTDRLGRRPRSALHRFSMDRQNHMRDLSVLVGPITASDLAEPKLKEQLDTCCHYNVKLCGSKLTDIGKIGHIVLQYKTVESAREAAEGLTGFKEDVTVEHLLSQTDSVETAVLNFELALKNPKIKVKVTSGEKREADTENSDDESPEKKAKKDPPRTVQLRVRFEPDEDKIGLLNDIRELLTTNEVKIHSLKQEATKKKKVPTATLR